MPSMELSAIRSHPDLHAPAVRPGFDPEHLLVIGYDIKGRVDKFNAKSIERAAAFFRTTAEPTGAQLQAWARFARGSSDGDEVTHDDGNLLTTAGLNRITSLIIGGGGQAWDGTHTRLGVGDTTGTENVADTDLFAAAGSTHRQFKTTTSDTQSNGVITMAATFATTDANFAWLEWCIDQGTANGTTVTAPMMNHKAVNLGTKTSAASWVFTVTITLQ